MAGLRSSHLATAVFFGLAPVLVSGAKFHAYASRVNEALFYADSETYPGASFSVYSSVAAASVAPIYDQYPAGNALTLIVPDNDAFEGFISSQGGNSSDPQTLWTDEWRQKFGDLLPYLYVPGSFSPVNLTEETVLLDTAMRSKIGDWYLPIAWRSDPQPAPAETEAPADSAENSTAAAAPVYNGTVYSEPYGFGNISEPDLPSGLYTTDVVLQIINFMPTVPTDLSMTIAALSITSWSEVKRRVPTIAALDSHYNYTLFLPPEAAISSALAAFTSDADLASFFEAHVVPARVVIPLNATVWPTSTAGGATGTSINASIADGVSSGNITAKVVTRDIVTDGGIIQLIDAPLQPIAGRPAKRHTEL